MTIEILNKEKKYHDGKIHQHRKEKSFYQSISGVAMDSEGSIRRIVDVRFYGNVHCCIWIHDAEHDFYRSGGGQATGGGYHKESAAFSCALENALISNTGIDGVGDGAIENAVFAIMTELGYRGPTEVFWNEA